MPGKVADATDGLGPAEGRYNLYGLRRVAANARRLMPHVVTATLPGVSHHAVPMVNADELNRRLLEFFG